MMTNNTTNSSSAVPKPRRKRNRDKSYSNDYFCLYYTQDQDQDQRRRRSSRQRSPPSRPTGRPGRSRRAVTGTKRTPLPWKPARAVMWSKLKRRAANKSSRRCPLVCRLSGGELNDEENHQCCLDKLKSLQSTQSELSLNDKVKDLEDNDEDFEEYPIGKKKSLDDWEDDEGDEALFPGGANSYARMRNDCCTTRSTTTTEQILSNLAKVELAQDADQGPGGDGDLEEEGQHSMELKKNKMGEENTTSMDTTSDLNQLEVTLDITHPVACRHASQLPLDGQPQSPALTRDDPHNLSRFPPNHAHRHRPPGSLFTLHSVKPRSFSANAAVSGTGNVNSWSVDLRRADEPAAMRFGRLEAHQKQLIADMEAEPRTEPVIASAERQDHGGEEDESLRVMCRGDDLLEDEHDGQ